MARTRAISRKLYSENVMSGQPIRIICDRARALPSAAGDQHDASGHHRYYGSSATNGGERIAATRRGARSAANVCDF
jgi:hypothetical protein